MVVSQLPQLKISAPVKAILGAILIMGELGAFSPTSHPALAKEPVVSVIRVKQNHEFFGGMVALIGKTEFRLINTGAWKFVLVSQAPKWDVTVYNPHDKTMLKLSLDQFDQSGLVSEMFTGRKSRMQGNSRSFVNLVKNGVPIVRYQDRFDAIEFISPAMINPAIESIIYAAYKMPTNKGFPLSLAGHGSGRDFVTGLDQTGKKEVYLSTITIEKVSVPKEQFAEPQNYKVAASMREVILTKQKREGDAEALQDLMRDK